MSKNNLPAVFDFTPARREAAPPARPAEPIPVTVDLEHRVEFTYVPERLRDPEVTVTLTFATSNMAGILVDALESSLRVRNVKRVN